MSRVQISSGPLVFIMIDKGEIIKEIEKAKGDNSLIIVEGRKDKIALEEIGLKNIFVLNEDSKSLLIQVEEIAKRKEECIILTDFDKRGKKMHDLVKSELLQRGIKINNKLRGRLLKAHLSHIEGISTFLSNFVII